LANPWLLVTGVVPAVRCAAWVDRLAPVLADVQETHEDVLCQEIYALSEDLLDEGRSVEVTTRMSPWDAVCAVLGEDRVALLPSSRGWWLLDPATAAASLNDTERAFDLTPEQRTAGLALIEEMARAATTDVDAASLLDMLPAAHRAAVRAGGGFACTVAIAY
jgi:hypothetical protein